MSTERGYYLSNGEREQTLRGQKAMHVEPIHPSIVQAICKIQATLEAVKKSHKNVHSNYMFAGIDDVYAALTRKMGEVGLVVMCLEDEKPEIVRVEKDGKTSQWARFTFSFVLATSDGTWADPRSRRSLYIQVTGAQSFGAAQSYAEKVYLKSLFKIPATTGEMELDGLPQEDIEAPAPKNNSTKTAWQANHEGLDGVVEDMRKKIRNISGPIEGQAWWLKVEHDVKQFPRQWGDIIREEYSQHMAEYGVNVTFNRAGTATHVA